MHCWGQEGIDVENGVNGDSRTLETASDSDASSSSDEAPSGESQTGAPVEGEARAPEDREASEVSSEPEREAAEETAGESVTVASSETPETAAAPAEQASEVEAAAESNEDAQSESDEESDEASDDEERLPESIQMRRRAHVAPALIALERIEEDTTYRVRDEGDVSLLATDIARVGQLFPIEVRLRPPNRYQIVSGFRRVAALRFLQRDKVLARLHVELSNDDALLMSLAAAIHARPVSGEELAEVKDRLEREGRLNAAARDMLDKALAPDDNLAPEEVGGGEQEIDADELAADVAGRLGTINQELALLADVFDSLDESRRAELLMQLRYSSELVAYLEGK